MSPELLALIAALSGANLIALVSLGFILTHYFRQQAHALEDARNTLEAWYRHATLVQRAARRQEAPVKDALTWAAKQVNATLTTAATLTLTGLASRTPALQSVTLKSADGRRLVISPHSAPALRAMNGEGAALLTGRVLKTFDRSLLTGGDYFDLEAAQAGQLFGVQWDTLPRLWFHVLPVADTRKGAGGQPARPPAPKA